MTEDSLNSLPVIKSLVTYLQMTSNPCLKFLELGEFVLKRIESPDVADYLDIYKAVGRDYIWNYRAGQSEEEIRRIIQSPETKLYYLFLNDRVVGMAELDGGKVDEVELVHFGLTAEFQNKGIGRKFLNNILSLVWADFPKRVWLSTCGMDHLKAVELYEKAGFAIFKTLMAEFIDYRFSDFYDLNDAPQIPYGILWS